MFQFYSSCEVAEDKKDTLIRYYFWRGLFYYFWKGAMQSSYLGGLCTIDFASPDVEIYQVCIQQELDGLSRLY